LSAASHPTPRGEAKHDLILATAEQVFASRPYHEVTMDDIAERAHVGKGTLYQYFESKEDLFFAVIDTGFEGVERSLAAIASSSDDPATKFGRMVTYFVVDTLRKSHLVRIAHSAEAHAHAKRMESFLELRARVVQLFADVITEGMEAGVLREVVPGLLARSILGAAGSMAFDFDGAESPERIAEDCYDVLAHGILLRQGEAE